jgi:hypothetical protein
MRYRKLGRTDLEVSVLGFGASPLGDVFSVTNPVESNLAVHYAIERGINFFDVSPYYGVTLAEQRLGVALAGVRHKVILATKCGRYGADDFDFSARKVVAGVCDSLVRLKTDYIDLLQVHDVEFGDVDQIVNETLPALRALQQQGKARYIGITGYSLQTLVSIAKSAPVDSILHWGVYSVPAFGSEWYPREMYLEGSKINQHHVATYGPLTKIGYKDFIPMFKAEKFDPQAWAALFKESGAATLFRCSSTMMGSQCMTATSQTGQRRRWGRTGILWGNLQRQCARKECIWVHPHTALSMTGFSTVGASRLPM